MFTRKRFQPLTNPDLQAFQRAFITFLASLEDPEALSVLGDAYTMTGTPTSGTGTFTTASYTINYTKLGDRILYNGSVVITTNGTAATSVVIALPSTIVPKENSAGTGCDDTTRIQLVVKVGSASKVIAIVKYDGTYPGADGKTLLFSGQFRV